MGIWIWFEVSTDQISQIKSISLLSVPDPHILLWFFHCNWTEKHCPSKHKDWFILLNKLNMEDGHLIWLLAWLKSSKLSSKWLDFVSHHLYYMHICSWSSNGQYEQKGWSQQKNKKKHFLVLIIRAPWKTDFKKCESLRFWLSWLN